MSGFPDLVSGRRPVGVVSFAQYDNVRREDARNEVEMLMPVVAEVFGNIGITKDDVGFICSGSTDYLVGGPFSFVTALDAVGRVAAAGRVARRDGRRLGALRSLGAAPGGRDRRRARVLLRALVDRVTSARFSPCSSTPTTWRRCGPTRRRWPPCRRRR